MIEPIRKTIEVPCDRATAFRIFVENTATWWPLANNSISAMSGAAAKSVTIEPHIGGRVYEIAHDDTKHEWGSVRDYQPDSEITIDWHVNLPPEEATQVHAVFTQLDSGRTRVDLTHTNWQILGDRGSGMRDGYNNGWINVFERCFVDACSTERA